MANEYKGKKIKLSLFHPDEIHKQSEIKIKKEI